MNILPINGKEKMKERVIVGFCVRNRNVMEVLMECI